MIIFSSLVEVVSETNKKNWKLIYKIVVVLKHKTAVRKYNLTLKPVLKSVKDWQLIN